MKIHVQMSLIPIYLGFSIKDFIIYTYYIHIALSSIVTDGVTYFTSCIE